MFFLSVVLFLCVVILRMAAPVVFAVFVGKILVKESEWLLFGLLYAGIFFAIRVFEELRFASYVVFEQQIQKSFALSILRDFFFLKLSDATQNTASEYSIIVDRGLGGLRNILFNGLFTLAPVILETFVVVLIISYRIDIVLGIATGCLIVIFLTATYFISERVQQLQQKWFRTASTNYKIMSEAIRSHELVRSFSASDWINKRYEDATNGFIEEVVISLKPGIWLGFVQGLLLLLLMSTISATLILGSVQGADTVTQLVLMNGLLLQISSPLLQFSAAYRNFIQGLSSAKQLLDMMMLPKTAEKISHAGYCDTCAFHLKGLRFVSGDTELLNISDIAIPKVQKIALWGRSGSGKTTLAKILAGIQEYEGTIFAEYPSDETFYCSQSVEIFDLSLHENITLGSPTDLVKLNRSLFDAGFSDDEVNSLRERTLGESGSRISGGQRKRLGIARMLYHEAKVMVFDEPTAELDANTALHVQNTIDEISKIRRVVIVTHDIRLAQTCDVVVKLSNNSAILHSPQDLEN